MLTRVNEHLLELVDNVTDDVRLGQGQGSDKESGRENNAKKPLNELLNYLDYLSNCKVYCVYVEMCNFYML